MPRGTEERGPRDPTARRGRWRKLYAKLGYYSLYEYCTEELHDSENEAYFRIGVARAARRFPLILEMIERGELHLTGAARCAPQLTEENHRELLSTCAHKTKREIEEILAARFPQPDIPDEIAEGEECGTSVQPLAEDRFAVTFSASRRCVELIERAKSLSSHARPRAALGELVEAALEAYVEKLEKQKLETTDQPKAPPARRPKIRATSRLTSNAPSTGGTEAAARTSVAMDTAAARARTWSSTTSSRWRAAGRA